MGIWDSLQSWAGPVEVNDVKFASIGESRQMLADKSQHIDSIFLHAHKEDAPQRKITRLESNGSNVYRVTVRQYMTRKATVDFDFMAKWNNDVPMPLRTMVGTVEKETPGMVYMKLHGDITGRVTLFCMKCGKQITNPVSQFFGMGPECGGHHYVSPFESEEDLQAAVEAYRRDYLQKITWEGWIIKSAITEQEVVEDV